MATVTEMIRAARERRRRYADEAIAILKRARNAGREELSITERARVDELKEWIRLEGERLQLRQADEAPVRVAREPAGRPGRRSVAEHREVLRQAEEELNRIRTPVPRRSFGSRRRAAFHEAGHAVAYLARGARVHWASVGDGNTVGQCAADPITDEVAALAGAAACRQAGIDDSPSNRDLEIAREAVSHLPGGEKHMGSAERQANDLVASCWPAIVAVAGELCLRGTLEGTEIERIARSATQRALAVRARQEAVQLEHWLMRSRVVIPAA
jgi:hypothetical protein